MPYPTLARWSRTLWAACLFALLSLAPLASWAAEDVFQPHADVTLLQINDVYSITPVDNGKAGGLARVSAFIKKTRAQEKNVEFLIAGDFLSPSVASGVFKGQQMVDTLNSAGITIASLGNHEFDFGVDVLRQRMKEARWQWVNANVLDAATGRPIEDTPPYVIRKYGALTVGYIGLCLGGEEISRDKLKGITISDPFEAAAKYLPQMQKDGATVIVALTHLNYVDDLRLARTFTNIDVIIGGHDHIPITTAAGRTLISKAGSDARNVARIDLGQPNQVLEKNFALLPVTADWTEDPATAEVVASYEKRLSAELDVVIGATKIDLDAVAHHVRNAESNLGNFIADAMREDTGADAAIMNAGSIRGDRVFPAGPLKRRDVVAIQPFGGIICKVELNGATLLAALEHGVSHIGEGSGRFPQVSGLVFDVNPASAPGQRVSHVQVKGQPLDPAKTYTLAITDYMHKGGDGYNLFETCKTLIDSAHGNLLVNVLENRVRAMQNIEPKIEGRVRVTTGAGK